MISFNKKRYFTKNFEHLFIYFYKISDLNSYKDKLYKKSVGSVLFLSFFSTRLKNNSIQF